MFTKKEMVDGLRRIADPNDDKITASGVKQMIEEPLGDADDDADMDTRTAGGKSNAGGRK